MARRAIITIGDRLRSARLKLRKSQFEVAVEAGIRPEVISRLETNKSGASLASLHKLAPVLGLTLDELVREPAAAKPPKKKEAKR